MGILAEHEGCLHKSGPGTLIGQPKVEQRSIIKVVF